MQKFKSVILPLVFSVLIALAATQPVVSPAKIMSTSNTPVAMFETKSAQETAELWVDVELGDYGTNNYYFTGFWGKTYRVGQIFWRWSIDVIPEDIPDFDLFAVYVYVDFVPGEALEDNGDIWVSGDVTINLLNDYQQLADYLPLVTAGTATWGTQASFGVSANGFTAFFSTSESYSVSGAPITQVSRDHDPGGFIKWHMVANTSPVKNSGYAYYLTILVITKPHEYTPWGNIELEIIVHSKWHHGWWDYPEYTTKIADVFSDTSIAYENEDGGGGGCPYVSVWNGTQFVTDNNILPKSIYSQNRVVIDRYVLQNSPAIIANNNTYGLRLFESNKNTSFFDRVKLFAVDHRPSINVALDQYGRIRTYRAPTPPKEAIDSNGNSVLSEIRDWDDGKYVEGNAGYWVVLNFGKVHNRGPKLVLRADYLLVKFSIKVSILIDGKWVWIADIHPRHYWSVDIVDLSELMPFVRGELLIRLYFTGCHKIDFVGLEAKSDAEVVVHELPLVLAKEYTIDKQFTKTVTLLLLEQDDIFVKMDSNQAILLWFLNVPKRYGLTRTFIFEVVGYYTYIL